MGTLQSRMPCWLSIALALLLASCEACSVDEDCSLNGQCTAIHGNQKVCICDPPWTGGHCERLVTLPVNASTHPGAAAYGFAPNVSSWGGSILGPSDGLYHLFVAQMKEGGLIGWGSQSECVHAVSDAPHGPFRRQDVALPNECHGPVVIPDRQSGSFLMFHQGSGGNSTSSFLHHSKSLNGPWVASLTDPGSCGMPTAAFHPNGTLFVVCGNGHQLVSAQHGWRGQWTSILPLQTPPNWEDPTLYFDRRANWHILYHVYALEPFSSGVERYSGHAYSADGLDWTFSTFEPFGGTVLFTDGSHISFATRERPQLVFSDESRTVPAALTSAVSSQPLGPWCDQCKQGACSQCKVTEGRDWTYTIVQQLGM